MEFTYYKILWHTATDWYYEDTFDTKEQAKEIAELLQDFYRADSYDIEPNVVKINTVKDFDAYKKNIKDILKKYQ